MLKTLLGILALGLTLVAFFGLAMAQQASLEPADMESMMSADRLYQNGHYEEAAGLYQGLLDRGVRDAALFYNLGLTSLQLSQPEAALVHFEEARRLDPRDLDIQANIGLTRSLAGYPEPGSANPLMALLSNVRQSLTQNELAAAMLALWFVLGFVLIARRSLARRLTGSWLLGLALIPLVGLLLLGASASIDLLPL